MPPSHAINFDAKTLKCNASLIAVRLVWMDRIQTFIFNGIFHCFLRIPGKLSLGLQMMMVYVSTTSLKLVAQKAVPHSNDKLGG